MKKLLLLSLILLATTANAQYWPIHTYGGHWIRIKENPNPQPEVYHWEVSGGVTTAELNETGLLDMGSGQFDYGYFEFYGESENSLSGPVLDFPPSMMDHNGLITYPHPNEFVSPQFTGSGFCNCDCLEPTPDTTFPADAFGFWIEDPNVPWNIWAINHGYVTWTDHMETWIRIPCPPAPAFYKPNDPLFFTDSTYVPLPDGVVLSGDSHLYLMAVTHPQVPPSLSVKVFLESGGRDTTIQMTYIDTLNEWHGMAENSRSLGLKSYNTAVAKSFSNNPVDSATDRVAVALPRIITRFGDAFTDTVFIRSDSMVVAKDPKVYLGFYDDANQTPVLGSANIDSAGYKYKSRWIANSYVPYDTTVHPDTLYRQFPINPSSHVMWDTLADSCLVTFNRNSLYAIGGKLTIECIGALDSLKDIDNRFKVDTDTLSGDKSDTLRTKVILIDKDPSNQMFIDSLKFDIIRSIAWVEYAGSYDQSHCHEHRSGGVYYNPRYNNYWDIFVSTLGDTCSDSLSPCENIASSATGTMQFLKRWWEAAFGDTLYKPRGYFTASWDSIAWNWKINIINGSFIFLKDNYHYMWKDSAQATWDSICIYSPEDSVPQFPNKEDLSSYGYYLGGPKMKNVTEKNWCDIMMADTDQAKYVRNVRGSKYAKPWNK